MIYHLENENKNTEYYNIIIYEFSRLEFKTDKMKEKFKLFLKKDCINKPAVEIIINIMKFIKNNMYIIIFDQYKKKYIKKYDFLKIEEIVSKSKLKLILCSSINDTDIRNEVIKTIDNFKGNPKILDKNTQYYYFYFNQIFFEPKLDKNSKINPLFELFNYKQKYKYLLNNSDNYYDTLDKTKSHIIEKVKSLFIFENELDLCKILLNIKNKIGLNLDYNDFSKTIKNVPLKYYILDLQEDYYKIDYSFPFLKYIEKEKITEIDCFDYFQKKKYLLDKSLDGKVKGEYFEMFAKYFIESKNVLPQEINNKINVKNIVGMEILKNETNDISKIIFDCKEKNENMIFKPKEKEKEDIKIVEDLISKDNMTKEKLNNMYKDNKNINYFLLNNALNYKEIYDENTFLNKKRKRVKDEERYYIKDIKENSILINQEDANGKTLDQAFIYGEKNNKIFLGFQMKCLSDKLNHGTSLKKINKNDIKENCQNILLRSKFDFNVEIKEWHYIIIAYYNKNEKNNIYCKQLERHCKKNDIEIFYINPEEKKLYDYKFKKTNKIEITNRSNLDYDFSESNPYNIINNEEINNLIDLLDYFLV